MSRIRSLILLLSLCALSACGFKPVHGIGANEDGNSQLEAIYVSDIKGRSGQVLRNKLNDLLNPENRYTEPKYKLNLSVSEDKREFGIQRDFRVTRYDIKTTASYELIDIASNNVVLKDSSVIYSDFNRTASEFSTFVAEGDATEKAAAQLAQEIKAKLAAHFQ